MAVQTSVAKENGDEESDHEANVVVGIAEIANGDEANGTVGGEIWNEHEETWNGVEATWYELEETWNGVEVTWNEPEESGNGAEVIWNDVEVT